MAWKLKYNIKQLKIVRGYAKNDTWNIWKMRRALPDHGFGMKGKECKGERRQRMDYSGMFCQCISINNNILINKPTI